MGRPKPSEEGVGVKRKIFRRTSRTLTKLSLKHDGMNTKGTHKYKEGGYGCIRMGEHRGRGGDLKNSETLGSGSL